MRHTRTHTNTPGFIGFPSKMVIAILRDHAAVEDAVQRLHELGVGDEQIRVLTGEEGLTVLDAHGTYGTRRQRLIRNLELHMDEGEILLRGEDALRAGKALVGILRVDPSAAGAVRHELNAAGATKSHYFGRLTFS